MNLSLPVSKSSTGWPRVRLGDLADHRLGKMLDKQKNTGLPRKYLRNPNIRWFDIDLSDLQEILVEEKDLHRYELQDGDVLICEGGEAGRAAIWKGDSQGIIFQKACHRVRVGPNLDARFFVHRLMFDYFNGGLEDYYTGATIKHFTGQDLARYEIPLPPLDEQKRIAAILDKADQLHQKRRRAISLLDSLTQSIFLEMFGDRIFASGSGISLGQVAVIQIGPFGSLLHKEDYTDDGMPLVNPMHIVDGSIIPGRDTAVAPTKYAELQRYHLNVGDVVLGRRGEMGRCAVVSETEQGYVCGTGSMFLRPDKARLSSVFLAALLRSRPVVRHLENASAGVTMPNLNKSVVAEIKVDLPAIDQQLKFANTINTVAKTLKRTAFSQNEFVDLFSSLQHRAFSGQL